MENYYKKISQIVIFIMIILIIYISFKNVNENLIVKDITGVDRKARCTKITKSSNGRFYNVKIKSYVPCKIDSSWTDTTSTVQNYVNKEKIEKTISYTDHINDDVVENNEKKICNAKTPNANNIEKIKISNVKSVKSDESDQNYIHLTYIKIYDVNGDLIDPSFLSASESSTLGDSDAGNVLNYDDNTFNHTKNGLDEEWLEITLTSPTTISKIEIKNRETIWSTVRDRLIDSTDSLINEDNETILLDQKLTGGLIQTYTFSKDTTSKTYKVEKENQKPICRRIWKNQNCRGGTIYKDDRSGKSDWWHISEKKCQEHAEEKRTTGYIFGKEPSHCITANSIPNAAFDGVGKLCKCFSCNLTTNFSGRHNRYNGYETNASITTNYGTDIGKWSSPTDWVDVPNKSYQLGNYTMDFLNYSDKSVCPSASDIGKPALPSDSGDYITSDLVEKDNDKYTFSTQRCKGGYKKGTQPDAGIRLTGGDISIFKNIICDSCPKGTYSKAGATSCTPCASGTYSTNSNTSTCTYCPVGKYSSSTGATTDTCIACSSSASKTKITGARTQDEACKEQKIEMTLNNFGGHNSTNFETAITKCSGKGNGWHICHKDEITYSYPYFEKWNNRRNYYAWYGPGNNATKTRAHIYYGSRNERYKWGTSGTYPAGNKYNAACCRLTSSTTSDICSASKYYDKDYNGVGDICKPLPANSDKITGGFSCKADYKKTGDDTCEPCPDGTWSSAGATTCNIVPDYLQDLSASGTCNAGYRMETPLERLTEDGLSQAKCKKCPRGEFRDSENKWTNCRTCPQGTYSTTFGAIYKTTCKHCKAGTYQDISGGKVCKECPDGKFSDNSLTLSRRPGFGSTGNINCSDCPTGQIPNVNKTGCIQET